MSYQLMYDDETAFEKDLVNFLQERCGWRGGVLEYKSEQELIQNWADILYNNNRDEDRLGNFPLTDGEMRQILDQIKSHRTPFNLNRFINGKSVSIIRDNPNDTAHLGKTVSLKIYDRQEIAGGKSCYQIARQPRFAASRDLFPERRGDVMLLINGMPLFHIELKKSNVPLSVALNQIEKYSKENIFSGLFSLVQIFIAMTPEDAVYFINPGPDGVFNKNFYFHWADSDNTPIKKWQEFTSELLHIPMAHELIGFYTVADKKDGILKVLRSYQYYAVAAIANKVKLNDGHWLEKGRQRGGFVWHTTGSGKTLTSFVAAKIISTSKDADKVVFLVDRTELDEQSVKHYKGFAEDENSVNDVASTYNLIAKLKSDDSSDSLIVASIQKMYRVSDDGTYRKERDIDRINKKRIVFIVDECHRDTFGNMMSTIKQTFPYAVFFGFSGTPIQEENKKKGCTSADVFGDELLGTRYTIGDGIRDGNVLGFDPYMCPTFADRDIKRQVALNIVHETNEQSALSNPLKRDKYLKIINSLEMAGGYDDSGKYIKGAEDYLPTTQYTFDPKNGLVKHGHAVIKSILDGYLTVSAAKKFHSIFATSSIPEAIAYFNYLREVAPTLKTTVLVDPSDNNDNTNYDKIEGLVNVIDCYNKMFDQHFNISTYKKMKTDISLRLSHEDPYYGKDFTADKQLDMLIVVNQMLTGFDSKWVNALYLDKLMYQENIIQAFSRTNRIFGEGKPFGMIFYYRYPHTMAKNVQQAIKLYSGEKPYMVYVDKLDRNVKLFNDCYLEIKELFESEDIFDFSHNPEDMAACAKFVSLFNKLHSLLEKIKVQGFVWSKKNYGDIIIEITYEIYLTLLQRYKELLISVGRHEDDVPYDLDTHISEISTGKIDADYMNSRFEKYMNLQKNKASEESIEKMRNELYKSFAMLPAEEQEFAKIIIIQIQHGEFTPVAGKKFYDYICDLIYEKQNTQIHRFSITFGLDENKLKNLVAMHLTASTVNEHNRFDELKNTADMEKVRQYFLQIDPSLSNFKIRNKFEDLLFKFITSGGFDL